MLGFGSILDFVNHIQDRIIRMSPSLTHAGLEQAGQLIVHQAQHVLGTYDYGWVPLAPATVAKKTTGDSPLLETGELRDSIHYRVTYNAAGRGEVWVGSDLDKAVWMEYGTPTVPARPFLGPSAEAMAPIIARRYAGEVIAFLRTGRIPAQSYLLGIHGNAGAGAEAAEEEVSRFGTAAAGIGGALALGGAAASGTAGEIERLAEMGGRRE